MSERYSQALQEFQDNDFIEEVSPSEFRSCASFYLPHHPVVREDKTSTKVRPVFDGSAKTSSGSSLNDCLEVGPNLNPDLLDVLLRFRFPLFPFVADIRKAFLQVSLHPDDRDLCRFLWEDCEQSLKTFRFTRIAFGLVSSPFLLAATVKHHLSLQPSSEIVEVLSENLYVDDFIHGCDTTDLSLHSALAAFNILKSAGMELRQFNCSSLELKKEFQKHGLHTVEATDAAKVLGVSWNTSTDSLSIAPFLVPSQLFLSKRMILSQVAKLYDPFGMASPWSITAKILIQKLWTATLDWDDPVPESLTSEARLALQLLQDVFSLTVPRCLRNNSAYVPEEASFHMFADASPQAFSCVVYFKASSTSLPIFVVSKSRVAPLKSLSLPRLELLSCLIGARLTSKICKALKLDVPVYCWSDSQIALGWIHISPSRLNVFVANRVIEIQRLLPNATWSHVPGQENPSDWGTRELHVPSTSQQLHHWFHGPSWLESAPDRWPSEPPTSTSLVELPELKKEAASLLTTTSSETVLDPFLADLKLERFSSLKKLLRVVSRIRRLFSKSRRVSKGPLTADEIADSLIFLIQRVQQSAFNKEYSCLQDGKPLPSTSALISLHPVLRIDGLIYSVGRTQRVEASTGLILLPSNHHLTDLIILLHHANELHSWVDSTLAATRSKYWIIRGRQNVKRILNTCYVCRRLHCQPYTVPESALPEDRITEGRAFSRIGVDYFGPFHASDQGKVYGILFTCTAIRAVILEAVPDQSFETFQNAFRRLEARVGSVETVFSDNAKVFRKAGSFYQGRITWKFIPSRSPHFGGFYERLVGSVKSCLRKTIGTKTLSFDGFNTLLHEVEGVLNRRPLSYIGDDSSVPLPIRPIDFMHSGVPVDDQEFNAHLLRISFRKSKILLDSFWNRWRNEYLAGLRRWRRSSPFNVEPSVGQVVVVHTHTTKNKRLFPLGIIETVVPGADGKIRSAYVRMSSGLLHRSIHLLYPLEAPEAESVFESKSGPASLTGQTSKTSSSRTSRLSSFKSSNVKCVESSSSSPVITRYGRQVKPVLRF